MPLARARVSVTGTFFLHGAVLSSWYARLPAIQERLELSPGQLGIALFGAPAGLLVAQPAIGALAARTGSRPIVAAAPLYLGAVVLPELALARPIAAIVGFAFMGLGLSVVFPLILRASTSGDHSAAAPRLATVTTVGYSEFLVGPPVIALLAQATDLRSALGLVCLLCAVVAALATHVGRAAS